MKIPGKISTHEWRRYLLRNPLRLRDYFSRGKSLRRGGSALDDGVPWMTYEAVRWLDRLVRRTMTVFEWGSGGSTLFFSERASTVVSVEHDPQWHASIANLLARRELKNVQYLLCGPEKADRPEPDHASTDERYTGLSFRRYAETIDRYPDAHFDLIVVDGRARPACMRHAIPKVRPGGYLLLDDSAREIYDDGKHLVDAWPRRTFWGPVPYQLWFSTTTAWRKP